MQVLTQDLVRAIVALDHKRSSMIPWADPAKFKGRGPGDPSPFKYFKGTTLTTILLGFYPGALYL